MQVPCVLAFALLAFARSSDFTCKKTSNCSCQYENGDNINLISLGKRDQTARFMEHHGGLVFSYNPCYTFTIVVPGVRNVACSPQDDVAVCETQSTTLFNIGTQKSASFVTAEERLYIVYTSTETNPHSTTRIELKCDPNESSGVFSVQDQDESTEIHHFALLHKCCCPNGCQRRSPVTHKQGGGLSTGSILLIVVLCLLFVYFVGGILYQRLGKGAQGIEMVPQHQFWMSLPGLIKDGVVFAIKPCKNWSTKSGYTVMK
ncbi:uncharacterized protein LOC134193139 [Corticium candelabrum]|uniref:uncharacterized protein LOC134193139 n=1 Tax=Corticium candelabrum TaxID=121492 RepID=UPI002E25B260|nr:uncharacterized protein LOC134193139 [Corticium candelabrum]